MRRNLLAELEAAYPWISWRRPVMINGRYGCRVCVALRGLHGNQVRALPRSLRKWDAHFRRHHGVPAYDRETA